MTPKRELIKEYLKQKLECTQLETTYYETFEKLKKIKLEMVNTKKRLGSSCK